MNSSAEKIDINTVLIIDDDETFCLMLKTFFKKLSAEAQVTFYDPVKEGAPGESFNWQDYQLLMMDYDLGDHESGLDWLRKYKTGNNHFPATIMLTAHGNEEIAVEAMRFGAEDYINKTKLSLERLREAISNALVKQKKQDKLSDTLTSLSLIFNKSHFYKMVKETIENSSGKPAFLLQIQINQYSTIYKKNGLLITDNYITGLIRLFAKLIQAEKVKMNIVRMGDAVISCLLYNCQDNQAGMKIAEKINESMKEPFQVDDQTKIESSISIGILKLGNIKNVNNALEMVDSACHQAEEKGEAIYIYKEQVNDEQKDEGISEESQDVVEEDQANRQLNLAEILKKNSIQSYFLPYIALSDTATSFNASYFQLRMNLIDNDGSTIDAGGIRDMDLMGGNPGMLDLWATRHALAQLLETKKENISRQYGLFIRLFEESLSNDKLFQWMQTLIKKSHVPNIASTLVFEMRPPEFIGHKENALNFINNMRDTWGISFALYDVINSAVLKTCIKQGGFEFIKFRMDKDNLDSIEEISTQARELGALTVIEKINNAQELNTAIELKFDYGQGDFIQPAMDKLLLVDDIIEM